MNLIGMFPEKTIMDALQRLSLLRIDKITGTSGSNCRRQRKRGRGMLCVEIDELTPCLTDNESGEIVETEVIRVKRKSFLSKYNKATGWYVKV